MRRKIKIEDIIIQKSFRNKKPSSKKLEKCRNYFNEHGNVDKVILINKDNVLLDNYTRYLILLENNIQEIEVEEISPSCHRLNTTYVFGVHSTNNKEYVWRLPKNNKFSDSVVPGSKVLVKTKYGIKCIEVTKVKTLDKPPVKLPIKRVVRCCGE